jgi:hypothetical protein
MENIIWGEVPAQRKRREEKYSTAVVTMSAIVEKGAGRKFTFNRATQELLGIQGEDRISFGFTGDGAHIYLRKANGEEGFQLTKTCSLSDKKTYEFIAKRLKLNTDVESDFDVVAIADGAYFEMTLRQEAEEAVEFAAMHVGEVSDEEDLDADLSSIPATPEGGVEYSEDIAPLTEDELQELSPLLEEAVDVEEAEEEEEEEEIEEEESEEDQW